LEVFPKLRSLLDPHLSQGLKYFLSFRNERRLRVFRATIAETLNDATTCLDRVGNSHRFDMCQWLFRTACCTHLADRMKRHDFVRITVFRQEDQRQKDAESSSRPRFSCLQEFVVVRAGR
jgi:hypothetical protein